MISQSNVCKVPTLIVVTVICACVAFYTISFFSNPSPCTIVAVQVVTCTRKPTAVIADYFAPIQSSPALSALAEETHKAHRSNGGSVEDEPTPPPLPTKMNVGCLVGYSPREGYTPSTWRRILGILLEPSEIEILDKLVRGEDKDVVYSNSTASPLAVHRYNAKLRMINPVQLLTDYPVAYWFSVKVGIATGDVPFFASFLTANVVSLFHPVVGIAAGVLLFRLALDSKGVLQMTYIRMGCILFAFRNFLDTLDGVVARVQRFGVVGKQSNEQVMNLAFKSQVTFGLNGHSLDVIADTVGATLALVGVISLLSKRPNITVSRIAVKFLSWCCCTSRFFAHCYAVETGDSEDTELVPEASQERDALDAVVVSSPLAPPAPPSSCKISCSTTIIQKMMLLNQAFWNKIGVFPALPQRTSEKTKKGILVVRFLSTMGLLFPALAGSIWESYMMAYSNLFDVYSPSNKDLFVFEASSLHLRLNQFMWSITMGDATLSVFITCLWFGVIWEVVQFYCFVMYPWLLVLSLYSVYVWNFVVKANPVAAALIEADPAFR